MSSFAPSEAALVAKRVSHGSIWQQLRQKVRPMRPAEPRGALRGCRRADPGIGRPRTQAQAFTGSAVQQTAC